jgi:hypothetical protein
MPIVRTSGALPGPRLQASGGVVHVPAFTDFKLHDICVPGDDPNAEALDMQGTPATSLFEGNRKFLTRKRHATGG